MVDLQTAHLLIETLDNMSNFVIIINKFFFALILIIYTFYNYFIQILKVHNPMSES